MTRTSECALDDGRAEHDYASQFAERSHGSLGPMARQIHTMMTRLTSWRAPGLLQGSIHIQMKGYEEISQGRDEQAVSSEASIAQAQVKVEHWPQVRLAEPTAWLALLTQDHSLRWKPACPGLTPKETDGMSKMP